jgi:hypothetical protein
LVKEIGRERKENSDVKEIMLEADERIVGFRAKIGKQELTDFYQNVQFAICKLK